MFSDFLELNAVHLGMSSRVMNVKKHSHDVVEQKLDESSTNFLMSKSTPQLDTSLCDKSMALDNMFDDD
jgi:hypothetical protein